LQPRVLERLLDQLGETPPFTANELAVLADARLVADDAVGEVIRGGANDGERRAQLVRHGGDELELLPREIVRAPRRGDEKSHADRQQSEHAGADEKIAPPRVID